MKLVWPSTLAPMNTDPNLHNRLCESMLKAVQARLSDIPERKTFNRAQVEVLVTNAYVTGISQAVSVQLRADGAVDAYLLQRVVMDVGRQLGGSWGPGKKG